MATYEQVSSVLDMIDGWSLQHVNQQQHRDELSRFTGARVRRLMDEIEQRQHAHQQRSSSTGVLMMATTPSPQQHRRGQRLPKELVGGYTFVLAPDGTKIWSSIRSRAPVATFTPSNTSIITFETASPTVAACLSLSLSLVIC